ncbi:binding-protein-dependent transport systems inner membrane component [Thermoproteus uzoniensis 768-20]|uniref:Binding-protein-dependent transport systems inner membrane component n=1 Tax=Thermoproteus uzoniensis (strain 768-20) TaxID=999630 RepID=F2L0W6_THEU7|nr:ABC transporter permease [Thermoproteus uzoniensis]AEA12781.1 binding-protein-dependent transport systems inner membrane component [Thermoproteus uzoniensis 768-20]
MSAPLYKELFLSLFRESYFKAGLAILAALVVFAVVGPFTTKYGPFDVVGQAYGPPNWQLWLGTDAFGRSVYSQLVYGLGNSLYIALVAGLLATAIGVSIGLIAGYFGGKADVVLNFLTNTILTIPNVVIILLIAIYMPRSWITTTTLGLLIGLFSWPWSARAVRAIAMSIRGREFILVAKLSGETPIEVAFTEVMPQMLAYIFLVFVLQFSGAIVADIGLEALGLLPYKTMTIGFMLFWAVAFSAPSYGAWWWFLPPGLIVMLATTALSMIAMSMDKVFNPRLREE